MISIRQDVRGGSEGWEMFMHNGIYKTYDIYVFSFVLCILFMWQIPTSLCYKESRCSLNETIWFIAGKLNTQGASFPMHFDNNKFGLFID